MSHYAAYAAAVLISARGTRVFDHCTRWKLVDEFRDIQWGFTRALRAGLPNLALMKFAHWHRSQGDDVYFKASEPMVGCDFTPSRLSPLLGYLSDHAWPL